MPRRNTPPQPPPFRLSLAVAIAISRIEGLVMPRAMRQLFQGFEKSGLSHEAHRTLLKRHYGTVSPTR